MIDGVNKNGVYWILDRDKYTYYFSYYFGEGLDVKFEKHISDVDDVDDITFEDFL